MENDGNRRGLTFELDHYIPLAAFQHGALLWSSEFQRLILQSEPAQLGRLLAQAEHQPGPANRRDTVTFFMFDEEGREVVGLSEEAGDRIPPALIEELDGRLRAFRRLTESQRAASDKRRLVEEFKLPDPEVHPELYRLYGPRDRRRLVVLWGMERVPAAGPVGALRPGSIPPLDAIAKLRMRPGSRLSSFLGPYPRATAGALAGIVLLLAAVLLCQLGIVPICHEDFWRSGMRQQVASSSPPGTPPGNQAGSSPPGIAPGQNTSSPGTPPGNQVASGPPGIAPGQNTSSPGRPPGNQVASGPPGIAPGQNTSRPGTPPGNQAGSAPPGIRPGENTSPPGTPPGNQAGSGPPGIAPGQNTSSPGRPPGNQVASGPPGIAPGQNTSRPGTPPGNQAGSAPPGIRPGENTSLPGTPPGNQAGSGPPGIAPGQNTSPVPQQRFSLAVERHEPTGDDLVTVQLRIVPKASTGDTSQTRWSIDGVPGEQVGSRVEFRLNARPEPHMLRIALPTGREVVRQLRTIRRRGQDTSAADLEGDAELE